MNHLILGLFAIAAAAFAQPRPQDAVRGLVRAFDDHSVVIVGESHWLAQTRDLYIALVRDPEFQAKVNDVVIEFGSRQSQPALDRYMGGEFFPFAELARVWRDTTKVAAWESPVYQEWLAAIRDVNRKLPAARRLRVLAGDSPIDWSKMKTHDDWAALGENNISFAQVINRQVARRRKVFVVLGGNHVTKNGDRNHDPDTTTRVELKHPGSTYVAMLYDRPEMANWKAPSLCELKGSPLAEVRTTKGDRLDQVADALLYLGPKSSYTMVKPPISSVDAAYLKELERRSMIEWGRAFPAETYFHVDPAWRDHAASKRVEALEDQAAVDRLWSEVGGAPLVEAIPSDTAHVLVTFLYRGAPWTKSVTLSAQLSANRQEPALTQLLETDLWYKTYWIRSDLRLSYGFTPDPASAGPVGARRPLELPAAPPQPWNAARPGVQPKPYAALHFAGGPRSRGIARAAWRGPLGTQRDRSSLTIGLDRQ